MTEPKFAIGERVAVCTPCLTVVIPATVVVESDWSPADEKFIDPLTGGVVDGGPACWVYQVADDKHWFAESYLRPIDKDEYRETEQQEIEQPIS